MKLTEREAEEYKRCSQDAVYVLKKYAYLRHITQGKMKWEPYDWQIELVEMLQAGENVVVLKSRQVGVSWTVAFFVAWMIHFKPGIELCLISQMEKKAIKLLAKVRFICVNFPDFIRREFNADAQTRISVIHERKGGEVSNESSIDSLTTTSSSARGDTAALIFMDEIAHMENGNEVYAAVKPSTSRGGQVVMASSPNGVEGVFPRIWMQADAGESATFSPLRVHYTDCGFDEEWLVEASDGMTEEEVMQEYELSFIGGGSPAFNPEHLNNCFIDMTKIMSDDPKLADIRRMILAAQKYASGVDTAEIKVGRGRRKRDYNAITSMTEHGIQVAAEANKMLLDEWAGKTITVGDRQVDVVGYVSKWHKKYPGTMFIEENGPGLTVENRHQLPDGSISNIVVKRTSHKRKQRIVDQFRLAIAGQQVLITDKKTWYQLTLYQDLGGGKYSAPAGSHDDLVIAILEAWDALIRMGGFEFVMPTLEKVGAYEMFSHDGAVPHAPAIPDPGLDSMHEIAGPLLNLEDWHEFDPTRENLERLNDY